MGFIYLGLTLAFTVYAHIVLKWQISSVGPLPPELGAKVLFLLRQYLNPWILSGFIAGFIASVAWMATLTEFELSFAYPIMSLSYVIIMILSFWLFQEPLGLNKFIGTAVILTGLFILTR